MASLWARAQKGCLRRAYSVPFRATGRPTAMLQVFN
jgi:hypothetical protein